MSREIIQFDRAMFESKLDAMVREKVERIVNAMPDAMVREKVERIVNAMPDAMVREKVERIVNAMPDASGGRDRQRRHRLWCPGLVWHRRADSVDI